MAIIIVLSLFYLFANHSVKNKVLTFIRHHRIITALMLSVTIFVAITDLFPSIFFIFMGLLSVIIPVVLIVSIIFLVAGMFLAIYHIGKKIL